MHIASSRLPRACASRSFRSWLVVGLFGCLRLHGRALAAPLRVATFRCDVTPWPGEPLVWAAKLVKVEDPLLAKGIVLEDGTNRYVLCAHGLVPAGQ